MQADALCRRFPEIRIASLRPHWCIPGKTAPPESLLPDSPNIWQNTTFDHVLQSQGKDKAKQLYGWNTYSSIANAFYLAITDENHGWESGHEAFFIVSPKIGSNTSVEEFIEQHFPKAERRKELGDTDGCYDVSKAKRLLGWEHS